MGEVRGVGRTRPEGKAQERVTEERAAKDTERGEGGRG